MKEFATVAAGCLVALALWKHSREDWFLSLCGLVVVIATFHYADEAGFPFSCLIVAAGFVVLMLGKNLFANPKPWKQRWAEHFRSFKEYRDARMAPPAEKQ